MVNISLKLKQNFNNVPNSREIKSKKKQKQEYLIETSILRDRKFYNKFLNCVNT